MVEKAVTCLGGYDVISYTRTQPKTRKVTPVTWIATTFSE